MSNENENTTTATAPAEAGKVEVKGSEHQARQEKINAILASGKYVILTSRDSIACDMPPAEIMNAVELFRASLLPVFIQAIVNDSLRLLMEQSKKAAEEQKAGEEKKEA